MATTAMPEPEPRYVAIGLGGIGGVLVRLLVPFLHSLDASATLLLIDGDSFQESNRSRMFFGAPGPKPLILAEELGEIYGDRLTLLPVPEYITHESADSLIEEGDVVFCQPDNHATRHLVERRCARLNDVALFSGGNDGVEEGRTGTYGNAQVYVRAGGHDVTNPLSRFHPEIAHPGDALPSQQGCLAAAASVPQLIFTNASVACAMLGAFYAWRCHALEYEEVYLDILLGRMRSVKRRVEAGPPDPQP